MYVILFWRPPCSLANRRHTARLGATPPVRALRWGRLRAPCAAEGLRAGYHSPNFAATWGFPSGGRCRPPCGPPAAAAAGPLSPLRELPAARAGRAGSPRRRQRSRGCGGTGARLGGSGSLGVRQRAPRVPPERGREEPPARRGRGGSCHVLCAERRGKAARAAAPRVAERGTCRRPARALPVSRRSPSLPVPRVSATPISCTANHLKEKEFFNPLFQKIWDYFLLFSSLVPPFWQTKDPKRRMRQLRGKPKKETSKDKKERKQAMQEARQQITTVVLPTLAVVVLLIVVFVYVATRPNTTE